MTVVKSALRSIILRPGREQLESPNEGPDAGAETRVMSAGMVIANRYEILSRLGEGGMGTVYRALDRVLARLVAIKTLRQPIVGQRQRHRFMSEARSAAALNHPNIVTIHDFGNDDTQPFIVMELVEGPTLAAVIEEGRPLTILQKLDYVRDVGSGLEHAHQHRVLHLDIKPSNVIVDSRQVAKILDFGIARISDESTFTAVHGTPCYMAPEQVYGQPDHRSDIFAMGALLYELVSGTRAFRSSADDGLLNRVLNADYEPLPESVVAQFHGIELVIDRTLAKNPEDRYQTVGELKAAIEAIRSRLVDTAIEAAPHAASAPFPQPSTVGGIRTRMLAARSSSELRRLKYEVEQFLSSREHDVDARLLRDDIERALSADGSLGVELSAVVGGRLSPGKMVASRLRQASYILTAFAVVFGVSAALWLRELSSPTPTVTRQTTAVETVPPPAVVAPKPAPPPQPLVPPWTSSSTPAQGPIAKPVTDEQFAKSKIQELLEGWCAAYEALDPGAVRSLYPEVNMRQLAIQLNKSSYKSVQCTIGEPTYVALDAIKGTAKIRVDTKRIFVHNFQSQKPETQELIATLQLLRADPRSPWVIDRADYMVKPR